MLTLPHARQARNRRIHLRIKITVTYNSPLALLDGRWAPKGVQMINGSGCVGVSKKDAPFWSVGEARQSRVIALGQLMDDIALPPGWMRRGEDSEHQRLGAQSLRPRLH